MYPKFYRICCSFTCWTNFWWEGHSSVFRSSGFAAGGGGGGGGLNSVFTVPHSFLGDWGHFVCMYVIVQAAQENHCMRIIFPVPGWTSGSKIRYRSCRTGEEKKCTNRGWGGGGGGQYLRGFKLEQLGYSISVRRMLEHAWMNFTDIVAGMQ